MKEESTKEDDEQKPAGKKDRLELAPGVEPRADIVTKPAGEKDRLQLAPGVESSQDITPPLHTAAAAIKQASASRRSSRPPFQHDEDDSSSFAHSSTSSARPGAVRVGDTESNHDERTLQTQEESYTEQGSETILPIAAVLPDDESVNNRTIAEAQIVETAKVCGQPRWLISAFLGVLVAVAIGVGLGIALGSGGEPTLAPSDPPLSDRRNELEEVLIAEIPSVQFGPSQREALNWLANEDPAILDFKTTPIRSILERYVLVTLYYSLNGPDWEDQRGFLSEESVCKWNIIKVTESFIEGVCCNEGHEFVVEINLWDNHLTGKIPSELGLLTSLTFVDLSKFLYVSITKCILSLTFSISTVLRQV
jgi:hypothetical protein